MLCVASINLPAALAESGTDNSSSGSSSINQGDDKESADNANEGDFFDIISGAGNLMDNQSSNETKNDDKKESQDGSSDNTPVDTAKKNVIDENFVDDLPVRFENIIEPSYKSVLGKWNENGIKDYEKGDIIFSLGDIVAQDSVIHVLSADESEGYRKEVLNVTQDADEYNVRINVPQDALYTLKFDYYAKPDNPNPVEVGIKINDEYQYFELKRILLEKYWITGNYSEGRNIISPKQDTAWRTAFVRDSSWRVSGALKVHLKAGENKLTLIPLQGNALIGDIYLCKPQKIPTYEEYRSKRTGELYNGEIIIAEAEEPTFRTATSVMPGYDRDPSVVPQKTSGSVINILGGKTWKTGGHGAIWTVNVPKAGYYHLSFKYLNNFKVNMPVFRAVTINGEVPFDRLNAYPFQYSLKWRNETLKDENGKPYEIWLEQGENTIGLTATAAPYDDAIKRLEKLSKKINNLYIDIKMATGNSKDADRDWDISGQVPNLLNRLNYYAKELSSIYDSLAEIGGKKPDEVRNLLVSAEQIKKLMEHPEKIPVRYEILSEDSGSILQMVGEIITKLSNQEMKLDRIYIHGNTSLPAAQSNFWQKLIHSISSLIATFLNDYSKVTDVKEDGKSIKVWITRARQFVNVSDQLTRDDFTAKTGINVEYSILQDEGKLALAIAAGMAPDAAVGISSHIPFNLALRNSLYNLKNFDNYNEVIDRFAPGAVLPFIYNKGCYALPETQNYFVLFYRKDILTGLGLEVPQTWDDVKAMLPTLQRNGMSFYMPISTGSGFKYYAITTPFIYQHQGSLFTPDGTGTAFDSDQSLEGMKLMTKLYTIYSIPLQVPSFYNKFRSGEIPVGISDFNTYVQLLTAAPEIAGAWSIALSPGVRQKDGTIARWQSGTDQSMIIFNSSDKKEEAWKFFDWWTSANTQTQYGNIMFALYGHEYSWNTSNLEAYSNLPWPEEHKKVVLEQWKWLKDVIHMPGDYLLEREISNAWNKIVFDGVNERRAIDDAVINSNREIRRKLEEFGYMVDGRMVKSIDVPDLDDVRK